MKLQSFCVGKFKKIEISKDSEKGKESMIHNPSRV